MHLGHKDDNWQSSHYPTQPITQTGTKSISQNIYNNTIVNLFLAINW